jgi:MFS family permease
MAIREGGRFTKDQLAGLEAWQVGLTLTASSAVAGAVYYMLGALSDRFGRRSCVLAAQVGIGLGASGLAGRDAFWGLLAWYPLSCVGETITLLLASVHASEALEPACMRVSMGPFDWVMDLALPVGPMLAVSLYWGTGPNPTLRGWARNGRVQGGWPARPAWLGG